MDSKNTANQFRSLPTEIQRLISDFIGPDPRSVQCKSQINEIFKSGCVGIPYFRITWNGLDENIFEYVYITLDIDYWISQLVRKKRWDINLTVNMIPYNKYYTDKWKYCWSTSSTDYIKNLRKLVMLPANKEIYVIHEGIQRLPFALHFSDMTYPVMYFLKYIKGDTKEAALQSIHDYYAYHNRYIRECTAYQDTIYEAYCNIVNKN